MRSFDVAPFQLHDEEHDMAVKRHNSNMGVGILFFYEYGQVANELVWLIISPI